MEDQLSCPICLDLFNDPKCLPCGHSVCGPCVRGIGIGANAQCPLCRARVNGQRLFDAPLPTNVTLKGIVEQHRAVANAPVYAVCASAGCAKSAAQAAGWKPEDFWVCKSCHEGVFCSTCAMKHHSRHDTQPYLQFLAPKKEQLTTKHCELVRSLALLHNRRDWIKDTAASISTHIERVTQLRDMMQRFVTAGVEPQLKVIDEQLAQTNATIDKGRLAQGWALPQQDIEEVEQELTTVLPNLLTGLAAHMKQAEDAVKNQREYKVLFPGLRLSLRVNQDPNPGGSGQDAESGAGRDSPGDAERRRKVPRLSLYDPRDPETRPGISVAPTGASSYRSASPGFDAEDGETLSSDSD